MTTHSWIRRLFAHPGSPAIRKAPRPRRLYLETMEDRCCPSTFTVVNTLDDGSVGSLRWAVAQANASAGADTINFHSSVSSIVLGGTQLQLTDNTGMTTIVGPGVTVSGGGLSRVFQVDAGVSATFAGLTITGGSITGNGAGLLNLGNTTLIDCVVTGNHARGGIEDTAVNGVGGGIGNLAGTMELINCTVTGNTADFGGGGVANAGIPSGGGKGSSAAVPARLTMTDCTVSDNAAGVGSGVVNGVPQISGGGKGSVTLAIGPATLTMTRCTVSDNLALEDGGTAGVEAAGAGFGVVNVADARLHDCTITGNVGGGVFNGGVISSGGGKGSTTMSGTLTMTNSTVSGNLAPELEPVGGGKGAAVTPDDLGFGVFNMGTATLTNCTMSGNEGGGVYNSGGSSGGGKGSTSSTGLAMINCTVSEHLARDGVASSGFGFLNASVATIFNSTISGNDGGLNNVSGTALLFNTIVAGNTTADLQGTGFSGTHNLIGTETSGELQDGVDDNMVGVAAADLHLSLLGNHGGPTQTIALLSGSPAINKGGPLIFTTLAAPIDDAAATSITVASTAGLGIGLYIQINDEILRITALTGPTTLSVVRGQLGTTAAQHSTDGPDPVDVTLAADQRGFAYAGAPDIGAFERSDTQGPTATIVVAVPALAIGKTSLVTITFSEAVTGFDNDDLTVANGTLSPVSSSDGGVTWTAILSPAAGITDATNVITLDHAGVRDVSGNPGTGSANSNNYSIDTARPTATIVVANTALSVGQTSLVTITFSEAVTDFSNDDLTVANGTLSPVSSSDGGVTWTAILTPGANFISPANLITLDNTGITDLAGNAGIGATDSNNYAINTWVVTPPPVGRGNVIAWINAQGRLVIIGDVFRNVVLIDAGPTAGSYVVRGSGTRINGKAGPRTIGGVSNGIYVNLGGGNDTLLIGTAGPMTIVGSLTIVDFSTLNQRGPRLLASALRPPSPRAASWQNSGGDTVWVTNSVVTGATHINLGGGHDNIAIRDTVFSKAFHLADTTGNDWTAIADSTFNGPAFLNLGSGNDNLTIHGSSFARAATLNMGQGTDRLDAGTLDAPVGASRGNAFDEPLTLLGIEVFLS